MVHGHKRYLKGVKKRLRITGLEQKCAFLILLEETLRVTSSRMITFRNTSAVIRMVISIQMDNS